MIFIFYAYISNIICVKIWSIGIRQYLFAHPLPFYRLIAEYPRHACRRDEPRTARLTDFIGMKPCPGFFVACTSLTHGDRCFFSPFCSFFNRNLTHKQERICPVPIENLQQHLLKCKRKTITLDALQKASRDNDYARFFPDIRNLEDQGVLVPIRAAGTDHAGLARKYSIHRGALLSRSATQIEQEAVAAHILGELHLDWYTAQPLKVWTQDLPAIEQLSAYLDEHPEPPAPASLQQRSYDMFRDEKFLLEHADFLSHLDISRKRLAIASETDPLMLAFQPTPGQTSYAHLVFENKAPWSALLPHLPETMFSTLILGYGWKICAGLHQLPQQCGAPTARHVVWYFGDLDWEGIRIFAELKKKCPLEVQLAVPFYEAFFAHPASTGKDNQNADPESLAAFLAKMPPGDAPRIRQLLDGGHYYPQEALPEPELLTCAKEVLHGTRKL